jgi:hypothetical protein
VEADDRYCGGSRWLYDPGVPSHVVRAVRSSKTIRRKETCEESGWGVGTETFP